MRALIVILTVMLLWLQYRLWVGQGSLAEVHNLRQEIARQEEDLDALKQRNRVLEAEVLDLKNGLEALEEHARSDLGMIRKGEVFFQVVEPDPKAKKPGK
jgi:cell division protein FtsB